MSLITPIHRAALLLSAALCAALAPAGSQAFESGGFRSGMTVTEFTAAATAMGYEVRDSELGLEKLKGFELRRRDGQQGPAVTFCNDRLDSVGERVEGGFAGFAEAIAQARSTLGEGQISDAYARKSAVGTFSRLAVRWYRPGTRESFYVSATDYKGFGAAKGWRVDTPDCS
jgi:hypothetical protein